MPTLTLEDRYTAIHDAILAGPNAEIQELIDSGMAWKLEGFVGRQAMDSLRAGATVLPPEREKDYWGTPIPSHTDVADEVGSPGSVANAEAYEDAEF
jgi:hypothetical protein